MGAHRHQKRRKLGVSGSSSQVSRVQVLPSSKVVAVATIDPSCTTCYRTLNTAHGPVIVCARCTSPVCAICSRTCTASPTSMPPTPHLTRSPTPTPPPSPRRSAPLSLNTWNTNLSDSQRGMIVGTTSGTKRRKAANEHYEANPDAIEHALGEFNLAEGCGRTICRNCSTENVESDSTTCHDCLSIT